MPPGAKKRREITMRYSVIDGSLWAVMMQAGTYFITPFALAVNAPILIIGALNSFPPFLDGIAQKASAYFADMGMERKKILVGSVAAQAFSWLLLAILAYYAAGISPLLLYSLLVAVAVFIFFFGGSAHPAWTALMGDVLDEKTRASWLGYRSRIMGIIGIAAMLFAGFFLDYMKAESLLLGFAILFLLSFASRILGAYFLTLHWDPNPKPAKQAEPSADAGTAALLLFLMFFSVNIGANYLSVYWLDILKFDYFWFSAAAAVHMVFYSLSVPHWGRLMEKYGTKNVWVAAMALNSLGMLMPILVRTPAEAIAINVVAGILWGGMVITYLNYIYEVTKPAERIKATANAHLMLGAGTLLGTLSGGFILHQLGEKSMLSFHILLCIAAALRLLAALAISAKAKTAAPPPAEKSPVELMANIITVYPFKGLAQDFEAVMLRLRKTRASYGKPGKSCGR